MAQIWRRHNHQLKNDDGIKWNDPYSESNRLISKLQNRPQNFKNALNRTLQCSQKFFSFTPVTFISFSYTYLVVGTKNGVTCSFVQTMTCNFFKSRTSWLLTILLSHYIKRLIWWQDVTILKVIQWIKSACCFFYSSRGLIWIN